MRSRSRLLIAGALVLALLGVPLAFMWVSGRAAAEAEHDKILAAPEAAARAAAERIARRVTGELNELAEREGARPYYQWQSLIVDPRGVSEGEAVVPSPLAEGPSDPLVLTHFQLDDKGNATSPQVNEAKGAPEPSPIALNRLNALRGALSGRRAEPVLDNVIAAASANEPVQVQQVRGANLPNEPELQQQIELPEEEPIMLANAGNRDNRDNRLREQRVSNKVYQQNAAAPELFEQIQQKKSGNNWYVPGEVTVRVGAFEWESLVLEGREVLVATRAVETPDAPRRQGFVVRGEKLGLFLFDGETKGRLVTSGTASDAVEAPLMLPGLDKAIAVEVPDRAALVALAAEPIDAFWMRSIALSAFAVLAALAILLLVIQAERLLERRQRFAAAAAHELRTPLAGLRMYAEMLAHGLGKPEKQKAYAERLASEAARLGRVVANVLDFTRLERKSLAVNAVSMDLAAAVEDVVKKLEPSIIAAGASLVFQRPTTPVMARVDADALAQILGNLVDNAEKYTRDASDRTISVTVSDRAEGPEVRVADRGPGLPEPRRLFRPFTRGTKKDGPAGLGLGLALARALARAMDGDLVAPAANDKTPGVTGAELVLRLAR